MPVKIGPEYVLLKQKKSVKIQFDEFADLHDKHRLSDPFTAYLEAQVDRYVRAGFPLDRSFLMIRMICAWGGIRGTNPDRLFNSIAKDGFKKLQQSLKTAYRASLGANYCEAIETLSWIEGIGISFRSKILRFLCPDSAVVLDRKIRDAIGYAESAQAYEQFLEDCKSIRNSLNANARMRSGRKWRTADVEMAIYTKIKKYIP